MSITVAAVCDACGKQAEPEWFPPGYTKIRDIRHPLTWIKIETFGPPNARWACSPACAVELAYPKAAAVETTAAQDCAAEVVPGTPPADRCPHEIALNCPVCAREQKEAEARLALHSYALMEKFMPFRQYIEDNRLFDARNKTMVMLGYEIREL